MVRYPKVYWRFPFASGVIGKIKIEINTFEREPALPVLKKDLQVENPFYSGKALIPTFQLEEITASKMRALYQRSKGRDLYDLWLILSTLHPDYAHISEAFESYRPQGVGRQKMIENLSAKLADAMYLADMNLLISPQSPVYDPILAGNMVMGFINDYL